MTIELNVLQTTGLAMLLFVLGRFIVNHVGFLRRCCIPAPVVGGLIFAIFHLVVHQTGLLTLTFDETLKNIVRVLALTVLPLLAVAAAVEAYVTPAVMQFFL